MFKKHSDKRLIEGLRKGDDKILNYLYQNYFGTVKSYIVKNSGSEDDAYDIFQDALMVVFKKFQHNGVELTTDLKGYVFGIARNLWANQLRTRRLTIDYDDEFMESDELERLLETPIEQIVQRSFLKLPEENQKVLTMHLEGRDYDEIAIAMGYKNAAYARRKKYLSKELLVSLIKEDPEYSDYEDFGLSR